MKKRALSLVLVLSVFAVFLAEGLAEGLTAYAYSDDYPNTYTNTGNRKEDLIAIAETQLGYTYNDGTKYGAWYGSSYTKSPWCAMFVSWCANQAGIPTSVIPRHADCDTGMAWFKNNGRWHDASSYGGNYTPQRGDIVYYSDGHTQSDSTHVGIVTGVSNNYLQVIEGNTDSKVRRYTANDKRKLSSAYVLGYGTPNYGGAPVHTVDSAYPRDFQAKAKCHIDVFTEDHADPGNYYIDPGDVCTIHEVYTDGCCKVTYPSSSAPNGVRTYYCKYNSTNFEKISSHSIAFSTGNLTLDEGKQGSVTFTFAGDGIASLDGEVKDGDICGAEWESINWNGTPSSLRITAKKAGSTTVTVYFVNAAGQRFFSRSFTVTVRQSNPLSILFSTGNLTLDEGKQGNVTFTFTGDGIQSLAGAVKDSSICGAEWETINWNGDSSSLRITAKKAGSTTVTVYFVNDAGQRFFSKSFTVTVRPRLIIRPVLVAQPLSVSGMVNGTASFKVQASGDGLQYQWYYKKAGEATFTKWNNKTSASVSTPVYASWNGAQFYCVVTDANGQTVQSDTAKLTVAPTITTQPVNVSGAVNGKATFSVKATGTGLTYQWYYRKTGDSSWTKWKTATRASASLTVYKSWNGAQFYCVVKDANGKTVQSNTVKLSVVPSITSQPAHTSGAVNGRATFSVKATGTGLTYQWYYKKTADSSWTKWKVATGPSASLTVYKSWNGAQFYCLIRDNNNNSVKTNTVKLTVTQ